MSKFENKTQSVKNHLILNGSITSWEAINMYKATRLSAIIYNLRDIGMNITSIPMKDDKGTRWAKYIYSKNAIK
jgi:hypothetical protein